jgi:hypothetical protein
MTLEEIARSFLKPIACHGFMTPHVFPEHGHGYSIPTRDLKTLAQQQTMTQVPLGPLSFLGNTLLIFQQLHCKRECLQPYPTLYLFSILVPNVLL